MPGRSVTVRLPRTLMSAAGERRLLEAELPEPATVGDLMTNFDETYPLLGRRLRDETGQVRQYVNVYVEGEDIRQLAGLATPLAAGQVVQILQSVAGG